MLDNAGDVLGRLARTTGRELVSFRQKDVEPVTDGFIVGYSCTMRTTDDEIETVTIYVNTSADAATDEHTVELTDRDGARLTAWAYPQDPALPSLPAVSYPEAAGVVLAKFGIEAQGATLTMEAYRPGKRAVLRVDTGEHRYYAKVVQPALGATIHELHERFLTAGVPVPKSLGYSEAGLVLLDRLPGAPAVDHIVQIGDDARFLAGLDELMRHIAAVPVGVGARESLARRASWYADRMRETAPVFARSAEAIIAEIERAYAASDVPMPVTVHGDLHLGQVFVDPLEPWRIVGILDIDTAGRGDPADDAGALYGHILVSGLERDAAGDRAAAAAFAALASTLRASWPSGGRTASIAATHLVGHALAVAGRGDVRSAGIAQRLLDEARVALGMRERSPEA